MNQKAKEMWMNQNELLSNATRFTDGIGRLEYDSEFVKKYLVQNESVCIDLCAGTGMMTQKMAEVAKKVYAIDINPKFLQQIPENSKIVKIVSDANSFSIDEKADVITIFGAIHYNTGEDVIKIYKNCYHALKTGGILIVSGQWGVKERVTVDNFSEELGHEYFAEYRTTAEECETLEKIGFKAEVVQILPEKFNRFENTKFKGIVAKK